MKNVLLIDSGSGGLNILKECVRVVPRCNFLMFCDNANLPYGNKKPEELQRMTIQNLEKIRTFFPFDIVILACNTLSCTCLEVLRKRFSDVPFIGTEPAVKPATRIFDAKDVLVLATEATIKHNKLIGHTPELCLKTMPKLASEIDEHLDELEVLEQSLRSEFEGLSPKAVVLGCTHYLAVAHILKNIFPEGVEFFDSANGVARRLLHFVGNEGNTYQVQIMTSSQDEMLGKFWWYYNQ